MAGRRGSTTEQLRHDIDSGRTRDKIAVSDPAAAPLGTDDEAGGTALPPDAVEDARARELDRAGATDRDWGPRRAQGVWVAGGILVAVAVVMLAVGV